MIIGVGLDQRLGLSLSEYEAMALEAQALGFESAWTNSMEVPDAFHVCSGWSRLTAVNSGTPLRTGVAVIPAPKAWRLETLANQAATVGQIAQGHFVLGIGTGGAGSRYFDSLGLPNRPLAIMRDYVTILRELFAGEEVSYEGAALQLKGVKLAQATPGVPVYLAALGPQMLQLAGEVADGTCLNWATPSQIAWSNEQIGIGAERVGRTREDVTMSMYIRVCVDDDVAAARKALGVQVLGYGLARPGVDPSLSYRGHFSRMGFDELFVELEQRRRSGEPLPDLVDRVPDELLLLVGYFGTADAAPGHFARLSEGLDEAIVRIITTGGGTDAILKTMQALRPSMIRSAAK